MPRYIARFLTMVFALSTTAATYVDADELFQLLRTPGQHVITGEHVITEPLIVSASVRLDCTAATFRGDDLNRWGQSPEAIFQLEDGCDTFVVDGGVFVDAHVVSQRTDLDLLDLELTAHKRTDDGLHCSIVTNGPAMTHVDFARVRCLHSSRTDPILSTTFAGRELLVQLDYVDRVRGYGVRARTDWDLVRMQHSDFVGVADPLLPAVRVLQVFADQQVLDGVTLRDCDAQLVQLLYWSHGDATVERCRVENITSRAHERFIEAKSTSDGKLIACENVIDQSAVDAELCQSPAIDAKGKRFYVCGNQFTGLTGSVLLATGYAGLEPGVRLFAGNTIEAPRTAALVGLAAVSESLPAVQLQDNVVTAHANPSGMEAWRSADPCFVAVSSTTAGRQLQSIECRGNQYTAIPAGSFVRAVLYDVTASPINWSHGQQLEQLLLTDNQINLGGGGFVVRWRSGIPGGSIRCTGNTVTGYTACFGDDHGKTRDALELPGELQIW